MPTSRTDRRLGLTWALSSAVAGSFMVIPWKLANEAGDPSHSVFMLLSVAAMANTVLLLGQRVRSGSLRPHVGRTEFCVAALLAIFTLLGNLASAKAIQDLSPALLNVLLRADLLFVAVLGWILLGERVEGRFWVGALVAVLGLAILQGPLGEKGIRGLLASGSGLALAAAACFGSLAIITRRFIHRIDPLTVNALRLWMAVAFWLAFYGVPSISKFPQDQILYATLAGMAGPFLGRLALMASARHIEARITTLATLTTPVLTLILAFVLLSDWPEPHQLMGGAIMIGGIAIPFLTFLRATSDAKAKSSADARHDPDRPNSSEQ